MTLSLATVGTNAFTDDAKINENYAEAVQVLNGMGVFKGYEDKSFRPEGDITRAEVAAIVYRIYTGDVKDAQAAMYAGYGKFDDVAANAWYAGYVGYCTNAAFIKGYGDGKFGPNDKVTGYQALAMILRAVGYGKNGEFEGKEWELHVAQVAQQIGALANTQGEVLKNPASRQLVAELLFRCLQAPQVTYTPAFGYTPVNGIGDKRSLGQKVFDLKHDNEDDVWGRPSDIWTYKTGNRKTTLPMTPDASYTVKVDECDIAKDLGISSSKKIENAYIDGELQDNTSKEVTTNGDASINAFATKSYVGAQGRLTEVYNMGSSGLRIVEINTWLGRVTKVTPTWTDKGGHTIDENVNVEVYVGEKKVGKLVTKNFTGVEASGFVKDQLVLVTISNPNELKKTTAAIESIEAAPIVSGGELTGWTSEAGVKAATHVFGKNSFNDADKFFVNWHNGKGMIWAVVNDKYGNAIGLVQLANTYLVIEKIEWKQNSGFGGRAIADLVLADGSKVKEATIANINGDPANNKGDTYGNPFTARVSDYYWNNGDYYRHIAAYTVNSDGSYNINWLWENPKNDQDESTHGKLTNPVDVYAANFTKGDTAIYGRNNDGDYGKLTNKVTVNDQTVFLLADKHSPFENGSSYTAYVGKKNVPSFRNGFACALINSKGYASLVVVSSYRDARNEFFAYVTDNGIDGSARFNKTNYTGYDVYKLGETTATTVYVEETKKADDNYFNNSKYYEDDDRQAYEQTGIYFFSTDSDGVVEYMTLVMADLSEKESANSWWNIAGEMGFARIALKADEQAGTVQAYSYSDLKEDKSDDGFGYTFKAGAAFEDFALTDDTKVILVTKDGLKSTSKLAGTAELDAGEIADLLKGGVALVEYTQNSKTRYTGEAEVVYFFLNDAFTPAAEKPTYKLVADKVTMDADKGAEIEISLTKIVGDKVTKHYTPFKPFETEDSNGVEAKLYQVDDNGKKTPVYSTDVEVSVDEETGIVTVTIPVELVKGVKYCAEIEITFGAKGNLNEKVVTDPIAASVPTGGEA